MFTPAETARADALADSREQLRAIVRATLLDVFDRTADPDAAETAIMNAAQQWLVEGNAINAAPCPGSGTTVERWHGMPGPFNNEFYAEAPDPGPYTEGELVTCRHCGTNVAATPVSNELRTAGRQYVARLDVHPGA